MSLLYPLYCFSSRLCRKSSYLLAQKMSHYSNKEGLFPLYGGCPCGQTRYTLTLPPLLVHACHCLACQRQTGSSHALNAIIETETLVISSTPEKDSSGVAGPPAAFADATHSQPPVPRGLGAEVLSRTCIPTASGKGQTLVSCSMCNVTLWNHYADAGPHTAYLRVGTLDRPWEVDPDVHIYTKFKRSYIALADGKPAFEEYYRSRSEFYREDVRERVGALDGKVKAYREDMRNTV